MDLGFRPLRVWLIFAHSYSAELLKFLFEFLVSSTSMDGPIPETVLKHASGESDNEWLEYPAAEDHEDTDHNSASVIVSQVQQGEQVIKKRGYEASSCWEHLNNHQAYSNHDIQSRCQSCNCMVKHHKKSEKAISHLNKCNSFRRSMADVCSSDLPSWLVSRGAVE